MVKRISWKLRIVFAGILMQINGGSWKKVIGIFKLGVVTNKIVVTETRRGHTNVGHKYYFYIGLHERDVWMEHSKGKWH